MTFGEATTSCSEEQRGWKCMGHISGAAAVLALSLARLPSLGDETSTLFLWSVFDNNFVLSASFAVKKWESGLC